MDEMQQEILEEFFTEAEESLDELEQDLIKLETVADSGENDPDLVDRLFRVLHTLKGGAGFLGFEKMAQLAHAGENLLDDVRAHKVVVTTDVMDALLATNDALKELLETEKSAGNVEHVDVAVLLETLNQLVCTDAAVLPHQDPDAQGDNVNESDPLVDGLVASETETHIATDSKENDTEKNSESYINYALLEELENDPHFAEDVPETSAQELEEEAFDPMVNQALLAEVLQDEKLSGHVPSQPEPKQEEMTLDRDELEAHERREKEDRRKNKAERRKTPRRAVEVAETSIRVETGKLDKTMNLVGELVLARNTLMRHLTDPKMRRALKESHGVRFAEVTTNLEQLSRVTRDLQMSVLSTRMQPIKKVFDKIPRQVRELKNKLSKEVDVIISGENTEVDKSLVEELADPMIHIIRNALDHGIESPADREEMGKKAVGTLHVNAYYEGNNVVIRIKDDGKGIDPNLIREVAIKKGVVDPKTAADMNDEEAVKLIMAAGFSTAEKISDVSGRGVGMDVVRSVIEGMKGSVDIRSTFGLGTTIYIYLPLTLAIIQSLVVISEGEGFAIPLGDISEVIQFNPQQTHQVNEQDVIRVRGEVLPLFYLSSLTQRDSDAYRLEDNNQAQYVIVVREGRHSLGVVVDALVGQEEAVVKPISETFAYNKAISGATITGDGSVHMILDVPYLIKSSTRQEISDAG